MSPEILHAATMAFYSIVALTALFRLWHPAYRHERWFLIGALVHFFFIVVRQALQARNPESALWDWASIHRATAGLWAVLCVVQQAMDRRRWVAWTGRH